MTLSNKLVRCVEFQVMGFEESGWNVMEKKTATWVYGFVMLLLGVASMPARSAEELKKTDPIQVAVLVFPGVELLDFAGPAEVFIVSDYGKAFRVFTVAASTDICRTMGNIGIKPDYRYANAPPADVVVVPGGATQNVNAAGVKWLRESSRRARITMSVCMGAFLMARAGLLDGIEATTHQWGLASLKSAAPTCKVVDGRRFVDAGRVITTAGVTAGIDGALHVVERLLGKPAAKWTAEEWMEYRRNSRVKPRHGKASAADNKAPAEQE